MSLAQTELMDLGVNSKVFYPMHGAGEIVKKKSIDFAGESKSYYEFSFINKKLTISTPVGNVNKLGIRPVYSITEIKKMVKVLKKKPVVDPKVKDYNQLITQIEELDLHGEVESFVKIIQFCNYEKKLREKEGRLIPVGITKHSKSAASNLIGEMAVTQGISFEKATEQFQKLTGIDIDEEKI